MKAWSVIGLLFAAAIFATIPISAQVTPRGLELSVDGAKAITYGHARRVQRRVARVASFDKSDGLSVAATNPVRTPTPLQRNRRALARGLPSVAREPISERSAAIGDASFGNDRFLLPSQGTSRAAIL